MPADDEQNSVDPLDLAQPYAERLAEDEGLRGSLTDTGFEPLLDWLTNLLIHAAGRIAQGPQPAAVIEQAGDVARRLGQAIVAAAENRDPTMISGALQEPLLIEQQVDAARTALPRSLPSRMTPDDRARLIVSALSKATGVGIGEEEQPS